MHPDAQRWLARLTPSERALIDLQLALWLGLPIDWGKVEAAMMAIVLDGDTP
jgi:hypothetical protein